MKYLDVFLAPSLNFYVFFRKNHKKHDIFLSMQKMNINADHFR